MYRLVLIALVTACTTTRVVEKPVAPPVADATAVPLTGHPPAVITPANAVCEAFKGVNGTAQCTPGHTDVGELHIHTATVTLGQQQFACRTDLSMLGVLCGDPIVIKQQPPAPVEDKKPAPPAKKGKPAR